MRDIDRSFSAQIAALQLAVSGLWAIQFSRMNPAEIEAAHRLVLIGVGPGVLNASKGVTPESAAEVEEMLLTILDDAKLIADDITGATDHPLKR